MTTPYITLAMLAFKKTLNGVEGDAAQAIAEAEESYLWVKDNCRDDLVKTVLAAFTKAAGQPVVDLPRHTLSSIDEMVFDMVVRRWATTGQDKQRVAA